MIKTFRTIVILLVLGVASVPLVAQSNQKKIQVKLDPKQQYSTVFEGVPLKKGYRWEKGYRWVGPCEGIGVSKALYRSDLLNFKVGPQLRDSMSIFWDSLLTPWEKSEGKSTATYEECVQWYATAARLFPGWVSFGSIGTGDNGLPIYTISYSTENRQKLSRFGTPLQEMLAEVDKSLNSGAGEGRPVCCCCET